MASSLDACRIEVMREKILGVRVDKINKEQAINRIADWIRTGRRQKLVVTLYSEFVVKAQKDRDFLNVINEADLVTADGVSILAALEYKKRVGFLNGLRVGGRILAQKVGETVTGVWLFDELIRRAVKNDWKVYCLGGEGDVPELLEQKLREDYPKLRLVVNRGETEIGKDEDEQKSIVERINQFKPDLLFVAYTAVYQYKWLARFKNDLNVGVMMGVGGTFDEYVGRFPVAPVWMEKMGLKWLWRFKVQPRRWRRIWNAVVVFPWMVWRKGK